MTTLDDIAAQPGMESRIALLNAAEREWRERTGNMPPWSVSHVTHHHDCGCLTLAATQLITAQRALINTLADALAEAQTSARDWGIANGELKDRLAEAQADLVTAEAGERRLAHAAQLLGWQMECERAMREVAEATIETLRGGPDIAVFVGNECVCRSCTTDAGSNSTTCVHHWERFVTTGSNFRCRYCGATKL